MTRWVLIALLLIPSFAKARTPYAGQLAAECDALIRDAIRRPYGWGWTADASAEASGKPTPRVISMDPLCTPAAGFVLLLAGDQLHDAAYRTAAEQVARGLTITQKPNGRITAHPIFSHAPIANEERAAVADRAATRCALGLLLALNDTPTASTQPTDSKAETTHRAAARCANWLTYQLTPNGFWPTAFPPDATAQAAMRIVRLDDNDYRDSTIALLLASKCLAVPPTNLPPVNPIAALLKVVLKNDVHGPNLWPAAITINGSGFPPHFPAGPDVLASRFAMQTLLAAYLLSGEHADGVALDNAATTLRQSRRPDGLYDRFLDPTAAADVAATAGQFPATTQSIFAPRPTTRSDEPRAITSSFASGTFDVWPLVETTARLKEIGRDRFTALISARIPLQQQLEAMLCGLMDDPMTLNWPVSAQEVPAFVAASSDRFRALEEPMPTDLSGRVQRIWLLLLRTKLEALARPAS